MPQILTIDDRPLNRQFLASLLRYGGHTVLEAADGVEGLDILRSFQPDLIVTDISMPNMDGYEFVDRLRRQPAFVSTPVIFYTAQDNNQKARDVAGTLGVTDIITKPSEPEIILERVNAALGKHQPLPLSRAIESAEQTEMGRLRKTSLKLSALVELGMELNSERDSEKLLGRFCATARHIIGSRKSMLGVLNEDGSGLKHFLINGLKDAAPVMHDQPPVDHAVLQAIVRDRKAVRINHADEDKHLEQLSPYNSPIHSLLGAPLVSANKTYGWLVLLEKYDGGEFTEEDERMSITLASAAAIGYENALFAELLQRTAEELDRTRREQLEMKDQFFSHVSHELRSPLAALHQFTTILLDGIAGELNPEQHEYLEIVLKNSLQLRDMISDLLDVTRGDAGKLNLEVVPVALCDVMRQVVQSYQPRAAQKGLDLYCSCPPHLPEIMADANRITQVFTNLLDNALKFTQQGSIWITAGQDREPGFVRVTVEDTGRGIPAASLEKVFDRLYQSPNQTDDSRKGLGLGLHICSQLIEMHGGRISVESREGKGAAFSFTLPVSDQSCHEAEGGGVT